MIKLLILAVALLGFMSCISLKKHNKRMRDYQIQVYSDTIFLYDNKRFVGFSTFGKQGIDSVADIILTDNL